MATVADLTKVRKMFQQVRKDFFPRWDRKHQWRLKVGQKYQGRAVDGYCDQEHRIIFIRRDHLNSSPTELETILIHEICHAVTPGSHGNPFIRRLEQAKTHAIGLEKNDLAQQLDGEIGKYLQAREDNSGSPKYVYGMVEDILSDAGHLSYSKILRRIAQELASTPKEVERKYSRIRAVYEKTKKTGRI